MKNSEVVAQAMAGSGVSLVYHVDLNGSVFKDTRLEKTNEGYRLVLHGDAAVGMLLGSAEDAMEDFRDVLAHGAKALAAKEVEEEEAAKEAHLEQKEEMAVEQEEKELAETETETETDK